MLGTCRLPEPSGRVSAGRAYRLLARETGTGCLVAGLPTDELNAALGVTVRVDERLTDPRTEVGQVGAAPNRMLGPGVPANLASTAFERFPRGDASRMRESGGAGRGLSIVQAIVQAHGGTVRLTSAPGDTTCAIRLPC